MARASATIKFTDEQEKTLPVDVKAMLNQPQLEGKVVVIRGTARRDEQGNLTVLANQFHVRAKERDPR